MGEGEGVGGEGKDESVVSLCIFVNGGNVNFYYATLVTFMSLHSSLPSTSLCYVVLTRGRGVGERVEGVGRQREGGGRVGGEGRCGERGGVDLGWGSRRFSA